MARRPIKGATRGRAMVQARKAAMYRRPVQRKFNRTGGYLETEVKYFDQSLALTPLTTSWATYNGTNNSLSMPQQGDSPVERDGRVFFIHSIHIRGRLSAVSEKTQTTPEGNGIARLIVYWDTQTNGAVATASDIMGTPAVPFNTFRNLEYSKRFIVLWDKTFHVSRTPLNEGAVNSFASAPFVTHFKFNKKFKKPIKVRCTGTAAGVAQCADNNIGMAAVATHAGGSEPPSIDWHSRIRFTS